MHVESLFLAGFKLLGYKNSLAYTERTNVPLNVKAYKYGDVEWDIVIHSVYNADNRNCYVDEDYDVCSQEERKSILSLAECQFTITLKDKTDGPRLY